MRLRPRNTATARPLPSVTVTSSDGLPDAGHDAQALHLAGDAARLAQRCVETRVDVEAAVPIGQPHPVELGNRGRELSACPVTDSHARETIEASVRRRQRQLVHGVEDRQSPLWAPTMPSAVIVAPGRTPPSRRRARNTTSMPPVSSTTTTSSVGLSPHGRTRTDRIRPRTQARCAVTRPRRSGCGSIGRTGHHRLEGTLAELVRHERHVGVADASERLGDRVTRAVVEQAVPDRRYSRRGTSTVTSVRPSASRFGRPPRGPSWTMRRSGQSTSSSGNRDRPSRSHSSISCSCLLEVDGDVHGAHLVGRQAACVLDAFARPTGRAVDQHQHDVAVEHRRLGRGLRTSRSSSCASDSYCLFSRVSP